MKVTSSSRNNRDTRPGGDENLEIAGQNNSSLQEAIIAQAALIDCLP
jgi:hypothetical protein